MSVILDAGIFRLFRCGNTKN